MKKKAKTFFVDDEKAIVDLGKKAVIHLGIK
jgi:hypothetical protein